MKFASLVTVVSILEMLSFQYFALAELELQIRVDFEDYPEKIFLIL